ncbi:hypothetical protein pb186bvf_017110 [Paramecium bursaria]
MQIIFNHSIFFLLLLIDYQKQQQIIIVIPNRKNKTNLNEQIKILFQYNQQVYQFYLENEYRFYSRDLLQNNYIHLIRKFKREIIFLVLMDRKQYIAQMIVLGTAFILQLVTVFIENAYFYLPNGIKVSVSFTGLQRWKYNGVEFENQTGNCIDFGCFLILFNKEITGIILAFIGFVMVISTVRHFLFKGIILQFANQIFVGTEGLLVGDVFLAFIQVLMKFLSNQLDGAYTFDTAPMVISFISVFPLFIGAGLEDKSRRDFSKEDIKQQLMNKINI